MCVHWHTHHLKPARREEKARVVASLSLSVSPNGPCVYRQQDSLPKKRRQRVEKDADSPERERKQRNGYLSDPFCGLGFPPFHTQGTPENSGFLVCCVCVLAGESALENRVPPEWRGTPRGPPAGGHLNFPTTQARSATNTDTYTKTYPFQVVGGLGGGGGERERREGTVRIPFCFFFSCVCGEWFGAPCAGWATPC